MNNFSFAAWLRLLLLYAKMDFRWLLHDRLFAVISVSADILSNLAAVSGVYMLAARFSQIGGITREEIFFMLSYTTLLTGVYQMFFAANNVGHISRRIGRGQVEHMLLQPVPLPVQLLCEGFNPFSGTGNFWMGVLLMHLALKKLELSLSIGQIALLAGFLLLSVILLIALSYLAASLTFYAPVQTEEISSFVIDALSLLAEYPLSGMPVGLVLPLVSLFPAGLLGWFPCLAVLGKTPLSLPVWLPAVVSTAFCALASYFFRKGLKYYAQKGYNRYVSIGHRR